MSCFPVQIDVEILTSDDIGEASLMSDVSIGEAGLMSGINMDEVPII